ncbi:MAG: hypothetical protein QOG68_576, partial [Solirubrobacteraceae bacterium]|nr:hypothetical protein [Solirubrobacteraceae bacterium]
MAPVGGTSLRGLGRRVAMTYRYLGMRTLVWRIVSFPLRFTPLRRRLGLGTPAEQHHYEARRWQRRAGVPLTTVTAGAALTAPAGHDLAILGADVDGGRHWAAALQFAAHREAGGAGITTGLVLAADGTIESAGRCRSVADRDQVADRLSGRPASYGPANVPGPVLAASDACALVRGAVLADVGPV